MLSSLQGPALTVKLCRQVCREPDDTVENQLLQCDACRACVHMECYGVSAPPDGRLWLCDVCSLGMPERCCVHVHMQRPAEAARKLA